MPSAAVGEAAPHAPQQDFHGSVPSQTAAPAAFSGVQTETPPAAAGVPTAVPRPITPPHTTEDSAPGASRSEPPSAEGAATVQGGQRQVPGGVPAPAIPRLRRSHSSVDGTRSVGVAPDEEPVLPSDAAVDVPEAEGCFAPDVRERGGAACGSGRTRWRNARFRRAGRPGGLLGGRAGGSRRAGCGSVSAGWLCKRQLGRCRRSGCFRRPRRGGLRPRSFGRLRGNGAS